MLSNIIKKVNEKYNKSFIPDEFTPYYNHDNEAIEWVNMWDTGEYIIRVSPSGKIALIEVNFILGKCTIL